MPKRINHTRNWQITWTRREIANKERELVELNERLESLVSSPADKPTPRKPSMRGERDEFIHSLLRSCVDCGEDELRLIEFHHRDPSTKLGSVTDMRSQRWTAGQIVAEVAKCDCLCPTCHRKRHLSGQVG